MQKFTIPQNEYLRQNINAYYHTSYTRMGNPGNPNYLNDLKNTYGKPESSDTEAYKKSELAKLQNAMTELAIVLRGDLPIISKELKSNSLFVCVVPRSKAEAAYNQYQLLFKSTVQTIVKELNFNDATNYIVRHTNTKTTHLPLSTPNYTNDGAMPYIGITKATCIIDNNIKGKDVLLIDDIYTQSINIDEDIIQALLDNGAKSVTFYAVGYTV